MKSSKILLGSLFLASTLFTLNSCSVTEKIETANEAVEEAVEEATETTEEIAEAVDYLKRFKKCTLDRDGNVGVEPVDYASVLSKNVHVITHGWAPGYLDAVKHYSATHNGEILLAWDKQAVNSSGERFFVPTFFDLAKSLIQADSGSTVLVFSWIDQSATDIYGYPWTDWEQMCQAEDNTQIAADEMFGGIEQALHWRVPHNIHLLGHSFGTKVVTHTGIGLKGRKAQGYRIERIQLTLFDSPEKAPLACANNDLCQILPAFEPDRDTFFVDNYISYYDKCLSDCSESLKWVVDATVLPYQGRCERQDLEDCVTCKHEAGVVWYTHATNDHTSKTGLWWSPLKDRRLSTGIKRYQFKVADEYVKMKGSDYCTPVVDCESD